MDKTHRKTIENYLKSLRNSVAISSGLIRGAKEQIALNKKVIAIETERVALDKASISKTLKRLK